MRPLIFSIIALLLAGCTQTPDDIDRLVAELAPTNGMWRNGYSHNVSLPETASLEQVTEEYCKHEEFITGRTAPPVNTKVKTWQILKIRQVHIPDWTGADIFTAVLIATDSGNKILFLKPDHSIHGQTNSWYTRGYDANYHIEKVDPRYTPLHLAVQEPNKEKVIALLAAKANVNAKDAFGETPLFYALNHKDMAELLISHHADVNTRDSINGWTPLHLAALFGSREVVKLLLANHADPNAKDGCDLTPLQHAVAVGIAGKEVIELLLAREDNINVRGQFGNTLLHYAAKAGNKDVAELLLACHADVNATNSSGETPLSVAEGQHKDLADLLRQHGGHE